MLALTVLNLGFWGLAAQQLTAHELMLRSGGTAGTRGSAAGGAIRLPTPLVWVTDGRTSASRMPIQVYSEPSL